MSLSDRVNVGFSSGARIGAFDVRADDDDRAHAPCTTVAGASTFASIASTPTNLDASSCRCRRRRKTTTTPTPTATTTRASTPTTAPAMAPPSTGAADWVRAVPSPASSSSPPTTAAGGAVVAGSSVAGPAVGASTALSQPGHSVPGLAAHHASTVVHSLQARHDAVIAMQQNWGHGCCSGGGGDGDVEGGGDGDVEGGGAGGAATTTSATVFIASISALISPCVIADGSALESIVNRMVGTPDASSTASSSSTTLSIGTPISSAIALRSAVPVRGAVPEVVSVLPVAVYA